MFMNLQFTTEIKRSVCVNICIQNSYKLRSVKSHFSIKIFVIVFTRQQYRINTI